MPLTWVKSVVIVLGFLIPFASSKFYFYKSDLHPNVVHVNDFTTFKYFQTPKLKSRIHYTGNPQLRNHYNDGMFKCDTRTERLDPISMQCFKLKEKGPCGARMIFVPNSNDASFGHCVCDETYDRPQLQLGKQCHFIYSQATCPYGFWLVQSRGSPVCQPSTCFDHYSRSAYQDEYVLYEGECARLHDPLSPQQCSNQSNDSPDVTFDKGKLKPYLCPNKSNQKRRIFKRQIGRVGNLRCARGTVRDRRGKCRRVLKLRFLTPRFDYFS